MDATEIFLQQLAKVLLVGEENNIVPKHVHLELSVEDMVNLLTDREFRQVAPHRLDTNFERFDIKQELSCEILIGPRVITMTLGCLEELNALELEKLKQEKKNIELKLEILEKNSQEQ